MREIGSTNPAASEAPMTTGTPSSLTTAVPPMTDPNEMDTPQMDAALQAALAGVTPQQLTAIQQFIERIGGLENAQDALQMLRELETLDLDDEAA